MDKLKIELVEDWKRGWRWFSVQLMAISAAVQFGADSLPPWLHDAVPPGWWKNIAGGLLVAGIVARFVQQGQKPDGKDA